MKRCILIYSFLVLISVCSVRASVDDKECGSNLNHLWLDVIFVVDNAANSETNQVLDIVQSLFPPDVQIGTGYDDPRSTRIGVMYSGIEATVETDWYKLQSYDDFNIEINRLKTIPNDNVDYQNMNNVLNKAVEMIEDTKGIRDNYKKLVVIFTHDYYKCPNCYSIADEMRANGTTIATVNMYRAGLDPFLQTIASYGMNFNFTDPLLRQQLRTALLSVNCHCPAPLTQYSVPTSIGSHPYAICVSSSFQKEYWHAAQLYCHQHGQYLATEFTTQKRKFNMKFMNQKQEVNAYFSGLFYNNGSWVWDQPTGRPFLPLDPSSGSVSSRSGCVADVKYADGTVSWTPISCSSAFPFICETIACDTEHYCDL